MASLARRCRAPLGHLARGVRAGVRAGGRAAAWGPVLVAASLAGASLLAAARPAGAQSVAQSAAQPLRFRHLGVDDGLPGSLVSDILQDRRGFMWIGTAHGVTRYDGHRFRTFGHEPGRPHGLPMDFVKQVYEDRRGTVWVVTDEGLSRYDAARDRFDTYLRPGDPPAAPRGPRRTVTSVQEDARGTFWVGTSAGLYRLDRATERATPWPLAAGAANVLSLHAGRQGALWVGTTQGLYALDSAGHLARRFVHEPGRPGTLPDTMAWTMAEDAAGALWVGTFTGLARLDAGRDQFVVFRHDAADPHSLARDRIARLAAGPGGGIWVGTENGGLDYYDPATGHFVHHRFDPNTPAGIGSNSIWALYQDGAGALWVGTYSGGLDVSAPTLSAIEHFRSVPGDPGSLSYNAVPSFGEGRDGTIWVATDGGGLNRFDPRTGRFTRYTPQNTNLADGAVIGVAETRRGQVWVATWGGGLNAFDPRTRRFTPYTTRTSNAPTDKWYEVREDAAGRLWVSGDAGYVAEFDPARRTFRQRFVVVPPGQVRTAVQVLRPLGDGRLAAGISDGGLTILDPATGAQTYYLAGEDVHAVVEAAPGVLWVGTNRGLVRLALGSGHLTRYGEADGLASRFVDGILPDDAGRLWVSTDRGLTRFDPRTRAAKTYTKSDGLQGTEFLMRSALRARDGTFYFGGNQGFNAVHPDRLVERTRRPPVVLTELQLFNRPVAVGAPGSPLRRAIGELDELVLDHTQNVVTFEFAALDFAAPEKNQYAYRLDGFDAGWQEVGTQHTASYTNLAPGRYTFRVKASNGDGVWNEQGATLRLVITPPVWQTWWARLLAAAALAGATFALWRFQQRRRLEVALSRQALRDPLTGIANRVLFRDRVEHALARLARAGGAMPADDAALGDAAGEAGARVAVLFLDLDDFKTVNDSLGHHAGDRLLQEVAARLLNATRGCDTVARLGGDEFAVLLENARGPADASTVAERIAAALRTPVRVEYRVGADGRSGTHEARVGVSVGIAFAEPGVDADALLRNADAAMYQAKHGGKGRHAVFDPALVAAAAERLALEAELAYALERGEFALAYQPIVALGSGAVRGVEALVRWRHPARGLVSPARFVPLAEASGLIVELGRWVLEEACRAAAGWPSGEGGAPVGVSVNVSGRQLQEPDLPAQVAAALAASGLPPARLTLEITESVLMRDTEAGLAMLRALKALGVRLAIDDFGTGYSSLRYLQQFPVDVLKIDKSFVDGIARDGAERGHDAALARTIVALGEMLALRTVAEGVETAAQRERLRAMGCDLGQGYLFARPLDEAALRARLAAGAAAAADAAEAAPAVAAPMRAAA